MRLFPFQRSLLLAALSLPVLCSAASAQAPAKNTAELKTVAPVSWQDVSGKQYDLETVKKNKATVFLFSSTQCPVANLYTPRMVELAKAYLPKGVGFFLVNANREDSADAVKNYAARRGFPFPAVKDKGTELADALLANRTPEAIVVDNTGKIRYRGAFDDSTKREKVARPYVQNALEAILAGKPVKITRALSIGCAIFRDTPQNAAADAAPVTFAREVAPILYANCTGCHREGESAPFPLETYQQAKTWAKSIKQYTAHKLMPPWKAAPGYGDFHDSRALTDTQIATLAKWADNGAPAGNLALAPKVPARPTDGWELGKPDAVLASDEAFTVEAEGEDVYRQFILPMNLDEEKYLKGIAFQADNRTIVHHIILYLDLSGQSVELDKRDPGPGYSVPNGNGGIGIPLNQSIWVAGWAPGNRSRFLPTGTAFRMPKGAKLVMQVHYHKNGQVEKDRSRLALYFEDEKNVVKEVNTATIVNFMFDIKPGLPDQTFHAADRVWQDTEIIAVMPHMHMLGRQMKAWAKLPDGKEVPLVFINDWDFNWQETYRFKEPLKFPKGTKLAMYATFDNSENNPRQPSLPPKAVRWGEQTTDEMCICFYQYTVPHKPTTKTASVR